MTPNYAKEVLEIHNEFKVASETTFLKAMQRLQKSQMNASEISKAKALQKIGAIRAKGANFEEEKEILLQGEISRELAELIMNYQIKYPQYKFINEEQVKSICKKYSLVLGKIDRYIGDIPEKNLQATLQFKAIIKEEDMDKDIWSVAKSEAKGFLNWVIDYSHIAYEDDGKLVDRQDYAYSKDYRPAKLRICAPVSEMDLTDMTLEDNYKLKEEIKIVQDPIILQPVIGGFLIVTAWGAEAGDTVVVNPVHN